tara:strand:- start:2397 stop:3389 length:993 start_codon:yes stop_codon:yes gene_type:complete
VFSLSVYFYPYSHKNNFVSINQSIIREIDGQLFPVGALFSLKGIFSRKRNTVVLNWVEDQMYRSGISKFHAIGLFLWFILIAIMSKIAAKEIIWFRHNYQPHNATSTMLMHNITCKILAFISSKQICLEAYYGLQVMPHPLYMTDEQIKFQLAKNEFKVGSSPKLAFVGAIKSYKGIHKALENWPKCQPMLIAGACDDIAYAQKLEAIIEKRGLDVECRYGYLSDHSLEDILKYYDFIVLAHEDNRMISSGTFYHAITFGCNLLCLPSKFTLAKAAEHEFVHILKSKDFTPDNIQSLLLVPRKKVMQQALRYYSREKIRSVWRDLLSRNK